MEKLTNETLDNAIGVYKTVLEAFENSSINDEDYNAMLDRCTLSFLEELKKYRQEEEQGLLVKLPCKVGDTVYSVEPGGIREFIVSAFSVCMKSIYGYYGDVFIGEFGFSVFASKAEAEKALEEMEK